MQRRRSATSRMTLRQRSALTSTPWRNSAAGAAGIALVDEGDVAAAEPDDRAGQQGRRRPGRPCAGGLSWWGSYSNHTYKLSVCKGRVGSLCAHAGRTHRGHPGPAHRNGSPALRRTGFRRHLDRGDPGRGRGEPRRPVPPLPEQDRPVPGRVRSRRGRGHRAGPRGSGRWWRDRPDADPRARASTPSWTSASTPRSSAS